MTRAANSPVSVAGVMSTGVGPPNLLAQFPNFAEWWHSTGDVPLERIVTDPPPGTATEQDLLVMVERDKRLVELVDGTLVEKAVGYLESQIGLQIATALVIHLKGKNLGFVLGADGTLRMAMGNIRLPDVCFISRDELSGTAMPKEPVPKLAPTIAIEVISEGNTPREMKRKLGEYFGSGSRLVWMIYPKTRTIDVFERLQDTPTRTLTESDVLDGGTVLPGFQMDVSEVFEPLSRSF